MSYKSNIYYSPEKFGLTPVAELEFSDGCYQFDTRVVWKDEEGNLYTVRDSGCSCPTPFEDYDSIESLDKLENTDMLKEEIADEEKSGEKRGYPYQNFPMDAADFLRTVEAALS